MKTIHKTIILIIQLVLSNMLCQSQNVSKKTFTTDFWLTDPAARIYFERESSQIDSASDSITTISVNPRIKYQTIDGFGYTLTGGSAIVINKMSPPARKGLLDELFSCSEKGIGVSYLRISIGSSDLSDHIYSYDDVPLGQTDKGLNFFSIVQEEKDLIPVLKQILLINPNVKIMGSPWSPPLWMKTNHNPIGGSLKRAYYEIYAQYLFKYVEAMRAQGIILDAITIQNEPLHPGNNPSMYMSAEEQNIFIKEYLGPLFKKNQCTTKIVIYDHNLDRLDYPLSILDDPKTNRFVAGTAFHLYAGNIESMSYVHKKYPSKSLYFTEQWINSKNADLDDNLKWHIKNLIIGATRNWSCNVLEWNLAADLNNGPHTEKPGCDICLAAVTINGDDILRNPAYYIIAHASKFIKQGSVRIYSDSSEILPNVAFLNKDGHRVIIILNDTPFNQAFNIEENNKTRRCFLRSGAVGSYIW